MEKNEIVNSLLKQGFKRFKEDKYPSSEKKSIMIGVFQSSRRMPYFQRDIRDMCEFKVYKNTSDLKNKSFYLKE